MAKLNDLKFRVWDDRDGTWGDPLDTALNCDGELLAPEGGGEFYDTYREVSPDELSHFHVDFCSGVEDDYGELIYEGDILKLMTGNLGLVYYQDGAFRVKNLGVEDGCDDFLANFVESQWTLVVVGNIRENPGLVK